MRYCNFSANKFRRVLLGKRRLFIILVVVITITVVVSYFYLPSTPTSFPSSSRSYFEASKERQRKSTNTKSDTVTVAKSKSGRPGPAVESFYKDVRGGSLKMAYFWIGDGLKNFLFKGFDVNAHEGLAFVCVGLASSAILYEGLRTLRDSLLNKFVDKQKANRALQNRKRLSQRFNIGSRGQESSPTTGPSQDYGGGGDAGDASISLMRAPLEEDDDYELSPKSPNTLANRFSGESEGLAKLKIFSNLILSTVLHMIYILLGYILMLSVMTFNVWILVAIAIGIGIGQFIFGVYRRTDIVLSHHQPDTSTPSRKNSSDYCEEEFSSPSTATLDTSGGHGSKKDCNTSSRSHSTELSQEASSEKNHGRGTASSGSNVNHNSRDEQQTAEIIVHSHVEPTRTASPNGRDINT